MVNFCKLLISFSLIRKTQARLFIGVSSVTFHELLFFRMNNKSPHTKGNGEITLLSTYFSSIYAAMDLLPLLYNCDHSGKLLICIWTYALSLPQKKFELSKMAINSRS